MLMGINTNPIHTGNETAAVTATAADHDVFLRSDYGFRNVGSVVILVGFSVPLALCLASLFFTVTAGTGEAGQWGAIAFMGGFACFFAAIVARVAWGLFSGRRVRVAVDTSGITVGAKHRKWEAIGNVWATRDGRGFRLCFNARPRGVDRAVWVDRPIDAAEFAALRRRLVEFLGTHHRHVDVGGLGID